MKVKTSELSGRALDFAVAKANKFSDESLSLLLGACSEDYKPSTDWGVCGQLIEAFKISCYASVDPENGKLYHWVAVNEKLPYDKRRGHTAATPQVAICRAVVSAKLGDEVEIPDELMEVK